MCVCVHVCGQNIHMVLAKKDLFPVAVEESDLQWCKGTNCACTCLVWATISIMRNWWWHSHRSELWESCGMKRLEIVKKELESQKVGYVRRISLLGLEQWFMIRKKGQCEYCYLVCAEMRGIVWKQTDIACMLLNSWMLVIRSRHFPRDTNVHT